MKSTIRIMTFLLVIYLLIVGAWHCMHLTNYRDNRLKIIMEYEE